MTTSPAEQPPARLDSWSPDTGDRMARQQLAGGWLRALPAAGVQMLGAIAVRGRAVTRAELGGVLPVEPADGDRWAGACWYDADEDAEQAATLDRYAAACGRGPVRTCADLLDLLVRAGVLWEGDGHIGPYEPVPGVDDVFPVDAGERQVIAALRAMAARL